MKEKSETNKPGSDGGSAGAWVSGVSLSRDQII